MAGSLAVGPFAENTCISSSVLAWGKTYPADSGVSTKESAKRIALQKESRDAVGRKSVAAPDGEGFLFIWRVRPASRKFPWIALTTPEAYIPNFIMYESELFSSPTAVASGYKPLTLAI
jgi:hypothetical protein